MKPRNFSISAIFFCLMLMSQQRVMAFSEPMGKNFSYAEQYQRADARPKEKIAESAGCSDGVPSGEWHDDLLSLLFGAMIFFIAGYKVGAHKSK
jgi:hypothetical protein